MDNLLNGDGEVPRSFPSFWNPAIKLRSKCYFAYTLEAEKRGT